MADHVHTRHRRRFWLKQMKAAIAAGEVKLAPGALDLLEPSPLSDREAAMLLAMGHPIDEVRFRVKESGRQFDPPPRSKS